MTYKHVKFADSPTMRALEKVAYEKGWVKPEPITKQASKKESMTPTDNLMTNVLKLCAGLRSQDMEKYANELETCFLDYKRAQTMYDAHGEKGEDVIHAAHPKGSHKMEDVDSSEAVFEDILDQHVKILQVVEKKPGGKLTEASQIISIVKTVFAQDRKDQLATAIESRVGVLKKKLEEVIRIAGPEVLGSGKGFLGHLFTDLGGWKFGMSWEDGLHMLTNGTTTLDSLNKLQNFITGLTSRLKPGLLGSGATQQNWIQVKKLLDQCVPLVTEAIDLSTQWNEMVGKEEGKVGDPTSFERDTATPAAANASAQYLPILYDELVQSIGASKGKAQAIPNAAALLTWFDKALQIAKSTFETGFQQAVKNPEVAQQVVNKLTDIKNKVARTQQKWSV